MARRILFAFTVTLAASALLARTAGADVLLSEIDYDQPSTDMAEWVELYNPGSSPQSLDGYELVHVNQSCVEQYVSDLTGVTVPAGGYVVIGNHACCATVGAFPAMNALQNGPGDAVFIRDDTGAIVDSIEYEAIGSGCVAQSTLTGDSSLEDSSMQLCGTNWVLVTGITPCAPNNCPVSVDASSWGRVKAQYR